MIQRPFFGGNWKMHHGPTATLEFAERFTDLHAPRDDATVVIFPPSISVTAFRDATGSRPDLRVGVQDIYWEKSGAYTGAISAEMAAEAGAEYVLAGHSERRHLFGDSDEDVARKVEAIVGADRVPVLCVGERLEEREEGAVERVVSRQLETGLSRISSHAVERLVIAYEPVWAIGTGRTAEPEDASEVHTLVRKLLEGRFGAPAAAEIPIIYGGSVKPGNIEVLLVAEQVDGVLVGGASLEPTSFAQICGTGWR